MQSLRDAGIVLVVILLAVSVRLSPLDETDQSADITSLTPQVEAASVAGPFNVERIDPSGPVVPASAVRKAHIGAAEHCTELLFHLRKTAEETQNEVFVLGAEEVIKVLPCSA